MLGLDPELLALVDRKVYACVFLFPDTPAIVAARTDEGAGDTGGPLWIPQVDVGERS